MSNKAESVCRVCNSSEKALIVNDVCEQCLSSYVENLEAEVGGSLLANDSDTCLRCDNCGEPSYIPPDDTIVFVGHPGGAGGKFFDGKRWSEAILRTMNFRRDQLQRMTTVEIDFVVTGRQKVNARSGRPASNNPLVPLDMVDKGM